MFLLFVGRGDVVAKFLHLSHVVINDMLRLVLYLDEMALVVVVAIMVGFASDDAFGDCHHAMIALIMFEQYHLCGPYPFDLRGKRGCAQR